MAPIQIGVIWVHDFACSLQILSVPGLPKGRQERPKEAKTGAQGPPRATQEKPKSRQEYGTDDTNTDWCHLGSRLRLYFADTERPMVAQGPPRATQGKRHAGPRAAKSDTREAQEPP